ncbi:hypothetical protein MROS_0285 [Melioribacter roseus P3M-2]|uniref:T9SS type A sorting domain-containing protein n=1 Tax=Melioribacter roseus (strain DSM 23840 / JCM 17771 / VKM B-2668 / P3M-2) TaxID=1191523 RepID=I6ZNF2_MELRP|nr:T9SS type A sorting domain-containing protein [Melioribacter roseus]AFN73529.1 hypothetical protein MROS_0285 [Melioribacter roseus P3M-2]
MNKKLIKLINLTLMLLAFTALTFAKGGGDKKANSLYKALGEPVYTKFNINNISTWFKNDGESDINQNGNSGFVFPKGSNRTAVFQSGFLWGGKVDGQFRVGGSVYRQGTVPGRILPDGTPANPGDPDVRIYRVRRDYKDGDLSAELADGDGPSIEAIRAQYEKDWNEWPASQGAPFEDVDGDGQYNPSVDIPGVPGADQTIWFVCNDLDPAQTDFMYGSLPMGIEEQVTIWGYNATGALGNMLFRKYIIINKNPDQKPFTEMYVSMWSDPDVGDAGDDYVGCDTTLSLGYAYNANATDAVYNPLPPPAVGFDFFQGPIVDGEADDVAIYKGKFVQGKKNLPMTAFYFFINGDNVYSDPDQGLYETGTLQWYNLFRGRVSTTGDPFTDPTTGQPTKFTLAGDPITGTGWIDGMLHPPGDRRLGSVSGPFEMAYGDTQEVVVAEIAAGAIEGVDRLGAIQLLKFYDLQAQLAYDNFFNVPTPPPAPAVVVAEMDQEIILSWGSDPAKVNATESYSKGGFEFQGYCVYQLPNKNAQASEARLIATYDIVDGVLKITDKEFDATAGVVLDRVVKFGSDSGIKRYISIKNDVFKGGLPLNNGSRYYFAVTSYAYNPDPEAVPRVLENPMNVIEVIPQTPKPGVRYEGKAGQVLDVTHSAGFSDGIVTPIVVDPTKLTGAEYTVTFNVDADGNKTWNVLKNGQTVLANQTHFGDDNEFIIVDGIQIGVQDAPAMIKGPGEGDGMVEVAYAGAPLDPSKYDAAGAPYKGNKVWHSLNSSGGDRYYVGAGGGSGTIDRLYRYVNYAAPYDYEFRWTENGGYAVYAFEDDKIAKVPFEIWNIGIGTPDDPSDDFRMIPFVLSNVATSDQWGWATGEDPYFGYPASDWVYWMDPKDRTPGQAGYLQFENACLQSGGAGATYNYAFDVDPDAHDYNADFHGGFVYPIGRFIVCEFDGDGQMPPAGTVIRINYNKPISAEDKYTFKAPSVVNDPELAKEDVEDINVFPNPYYGVNPQEINKYQRFVTFNHLPQKATIRIFNLAGQLVRTLHKDTPDQFFRWDLNNESDLPVASGLYVVHIDMPDLGKTKILKVAIIQEQQILDRF